jgi:hypothetical protein
VRSLFPSSYAAAFFNFPHLILQCGAVRWNEESRKTNTAKVKMKRLRNVEELLFVFFFSFIFPRCLKNKTKKLIVVLRLSTKSSLLG